MAKFKLNDKVILMDNSDIWVNHLEKNKVYTVKNIVDLYNNYEIELCEEPNHLGRSYMPTRFISANSHIIKEKLGIK